MADTNEYILLKWGTLKGWNIAGNDAAMAALQRYFDDEVSMGSMFQRDTDGQKQAICDLIDAVNGEIRNDWSGELMTKDEAKKYVLEYGKKAATGEPG